MLIVVFVVAVVWLNYFVVVCILVWFNLLFCGVLTVGLTVVC